jgi:hypothetical protein
MAANGKAVARWAALALLAAAGCGDPTVGDVSGTVKFDGTPLEMGAITFYPLDGQSRTAGTVIKNGQYYASKVPVGAKKVVISGTKFLSGKERRLYDTADSPTMPKSEQLLPAKYSSVDVSELRFDVESGSNPKDWDLPAK